MRVARIVFSGGVQRSISLSIFVAIRHRYTRLLIRLQDSMKFDALLSRGRFYRGVSMRRDLILQEIHNQAHSSYNGVLISSQILQSSRTHSRHQIERIAYLQSKMCILQTTTTNSYVLQFADYNHGMIWALVASHSIDEHIHEKINLTNHDKFHRCQEVGIDVASSRFEN